MKLSKAIEILNTHCNREKEVDEEELWDTEKLGIAALGQFVILRKALPIFKDVLLPREDKE